MFSFHKTNDPANARPDVEVSRYKWDTGQLKSVLQTAVNGIIVINASGAIIDFNPVAENVFGYKLNEVLSFDIEALMSIPFNRKNSTGAGLLGNVENQHLIGTKLEVTGTKKDGTPFPISISINETRSNGELFFTCMIRDLTEAKKAENDLLLSQAYLTAIVENTNEAIWSVDRDYNLMACNSVFKYLCKKYFGLSLKVGEKIFDTNQNNNYQYFYKYYERALAGEYFATDEYFTVNGEKRYYEANFNPIRGKKGIEGVSIFLKDITGRKQAELDLIEAHKKIKEINDEYDMFVYKASHDLRGPLASIQGLIQLFKTEAKEPKITKLVQMLDERTIVLNEILRVLADATAMKQEEIEPTPIDINAVLEEYKLQKNNLFGENNIEFTVDCEHKGLFYTDEKLFKNIVHKILDNAFCYRDTTKAKSSISLKINYTNEVLQLVFSDNGIGIHQEQLKKVFDMFHRGTERSKGAGLGLYIAKKSTEKLKGEIHLQSRHSEGTDVNVILPDIK